MSTLNETPKANRVHIAFFGLRNAGKSTLVNSFTGQNIAIVSDVAGTTTDPVSKAMEIPPLGPCLLTDTAGLDDTGELGAMRVARSLETLAVSDVAVWVSTGDDSAHPSFLSLATDCRRRNVPLVIYRRGDSVEALKGRIAALGKLSADPALLDGLIEPSDRVVCVCPIDESAPKGRLILPQVQVIRECLDRGVVCTVCRPSELKAALSGSDARTLVVTDSQAFAEVKRIVEGMPVRLTSFSVLFARQKGDIVRFLEGLSAIKKLSDGDRVLIAEGCTHHRQCNDIGTVKIPKALEKLSGKKLDFSFASGSSFDLALGEGDRAVRLVVQCGGCMLTRREMLRRISLCRESGVGIVNYGLLLAAAAGMDGIGTDGLVK